MRIIAGQLKNREFKSPHGHRTHPMSDKIRGALFNVLGDIDGLTFLDAFAGSGAVAFEAASRGAKSVVAIDKDSAAHKVLEQNVKELGTANVLPVKANTGGWSIHNMETRFDIVIIDPPFDDIRPDLIRNLASRHPKKLGLVVLSLPSKLDLKLDGPFEHLSTKKYGDAQLVFYRKL